MIKIDLINRIELIEAQIENVKHSGHFRKRNRHKYISTRNGTRVIKDTF
jgi:predicted transcriptional regulator